MTRYLILLYGIVCYIIGLAGLTFFILFVSGWQDFPWHLEAGDPNSPVLAILLNAGLMTMFGLQHSVMARRKFKNALTRLILPSVERSTYVLVSGILTCLLCLLWQPLEGTFWQVDHAFGRAILFSLQLSGWALAILATFMINHLELLGLQQVWYRFRDEPEPQPHFTERLLYRLVRHPLQLGLLIGIWSAPTMTMTHLMFSGTMTVYVLVGLYLEEKDLVDSLGEPYEAYRHRTRMLIPFPKRTSARP